MIKVFEALSPEFAANAFRDFADFLEAGLRPDINVARSESELVKPCPDRELEAVTATPQVRARLQQPDCRVERCRTEVHHRVAPTSAERTAL